MHGPDCMLSKQRKMIGSQLRLYHCEGAINAVAVTYPSTLIFRLTFVVTRSPSYRSVIFGKHEMSR
jgi:hypothetical protein